MAVKDKDWNIVTLKQLKKQNKPTKKALQKSVVWKKVFWIEWSSYDLRDWVILEQIWDKVKVDCILRTLKKNPDKKRENRVVQLNSLTFNKR